MTKRESIIYGLGTFTGLTIATITDEFLLTLALCILAGVIVGLAYTIRARA